MQTTLYQVILQSAKKACELQSETGAMPAGHNGLYRDKETPVRNTSHWLITFIKAYGIQADPILKNSAKKALSYLMGQDTRPQQYTFWHRDVPGKDKCNGLMGQAWTIEALVEAAIFFNDEAPLKLAEEVFLLHTFNKKASLWHRRDTDGRKLSFDLTFNHQLWFAAAGGLLSKLSHTKEIKASIEHFMEHLPRLLNIYENGLICHLLKPHLSVKEVVKLILKPLPKYKRIEAERYYKAIGYHSFNMYAFGLLKGIFKNHIFWQTSGFKRTISYLSSKEYKKDVLYNVYAYPYNPPGFEVPFAMEVFSSINPKEKAFWVNSQFHHGLSYEEKLFSKGSKDPYTASARLYEATRLSDIEVEF
ncbi:MAG: agl cluster protein AglQ [Bacteroidota bacterium]